MLEFFLWGLAALAGLILLDRLFLWMEARGWVYYRKKKSKGGFADVLIGSNVIDPGMRYMHEARQEKAGEEDEDDGDDEGKRQDEDRLKRKNAEPG